MKNKKDEGTDNKSGKSFRDHQSAVDTALNEKIKSETNNDGSQLNRKEKRNHSTNVSEKKTGGGKQKSLGD